MKRVPPGAARTEPTEATNADLPAYAGKGPLFLASSCRNVVSLFEPLIKPAGNLLYISAACEARNAGRDDSERRDVSDGVQHEEREEVDRRILIDKGFSLRDFALTGCRTSALERALGDADAIYLCGYDPDYLGNALHESGRAPTLVEAIAGGVPYFGVSAGALLAGQDFAIIRHIWTSNVSREPIATLQLVPFLVLPHAELYGNKYEGLPLGHHKRVGENEALLVTAAGVKRLNAETGLSTED